ncbi:MAG: SUMF1/EgtB/PvdO family nonheme iron enzyme [Phycisphaeraceae bacterium]|nr:SUMF1/EgtB/PvdO family nonheme iron enzyme [Phycisphaeraceae bacterium]
MPPNRSPQVPGPRPVASCRCSSTPSQREGAGGGFVPRDFHATPKYRSSDGPLTRHRPTARSPLHLFFFALLALTPATAFANPIPPSGIPLTPTAIASGGRITVSHGIEFVTIGAPGNAPWMGDGTPQDRAIGRGGVGYEYRIGRFEVTTEQWVEFYNAAFDRPADDRIPHLIPSDHWGAVSTPAMTPGGQRWRVPAGNEYRAVGDISWRMAAIYCNWLHNDKSTNREAFLNGAYDVSTFGYVGDSNTFSDQAARSPGAKYFIPTWDEWLKAAHYDPNRNGPDQGGWWTWSNATDVGIIPGPPPSIIPGGGTGGADGQANSGAWWMTHPSPSPFSVPLGSYPTVQSPWGLLDVAGGTTEWTEEQIILQSGTRFRVSDGSFWFDGPPQHDHIRSISSGQFPNVSTFEYGFRIAAVIPAPPSFALLALGLGVACSRRRKDSSSCARGGTSARPLHRLCLRRAGSRTVTWWRPSTAARSSRLPSTTTGRLSTSARSRPTPRSTFSTTRPVRRRGLGALFPRSLVPSFP